MARAAERLIPVSLELGGKDPIIGVGDADLERLGVRGRCRETVRSRLAIECVYVEARVYEQFIASSGGGSHGWGRGNRVSPAPSTWAR